MKEQEIKFENILSPLEMWERFGDVQDWKKDGEVYINVFYFVAELLRTAYEGIRYEKLFEGIPYAYRRILDRAENSKGPSVWDVVSERRLKKSSGNF